MAAQNPNSPFASGGSMYTPEMAAAAAEENNQTGPVDETGHTVGSSNPPPGESTGVDVGGGDPADAVGWQAGENPPLMDLPPDDIDAYRNAEYDAQAARAKTTNRNVKQEELSQYQLEQMLKSNSPLMRQAAAQGLARGGARGLMNSSLATGAAQGAMIRNAQPFALQDSSWYGKTASENMAAKNEMSALNAKLATEARMAGQKLGADRDAQLADQQWKWDEMREEEAWKTSEAEAGRSWQTGERLGSQEHEAAQNELNRNWTSNENMLTNELAWRQSKLDSATRLGISRAQAWADMYSAIMNNENPKFSAAERNAAVDRMIADLDKYYPDEVASDYEQSYLDNKGEWYQDENGQWHGPADEEYNPGELLWTQDEHGNYVPYNFELSTQQGGDAGAANSNTPDTI